MKVHQFIYTRLGKEESPTGTEGFQVAFWPGSVLEKGDLLEIQRHIYFPPGVRQKRSLFFLELGGERYLFLLFFTDQPHVKDTAGRGGIFLVHGFILPPPLWRSLATPTDAFDLVQDKVLTDYNEALSSPHVDRRTGDMAPLELSAGKELPLPGPKSAFERELLRLLVKKALRPQALPKFLIRAPEEQAIQLFGRLLAHLPDELKPQLSFDPLYDGGDVGFSPFPVMAYTEQRPFGGGSIEVELLEGRIQGLPEGFTLSPETPFERWLFSQSGPGRKQEIEACWALSLFLTEGRPADPSLVSPAFASANREEIERLFQNGLSRLLGPLLSSHLSSAMKDVAEGEKLSLLLKGMPLEPFASAAERLILAKGLTTKEISEGLPPQLVKAGGRLLMLLDKVWKGRPLSAEEIFPLEAEEKKELLRYLILYGWTKEGWLKQVLTKEKRLFEALLSEPGVRELLLKAISHDKVLGPVAHLLSGEVMDQGLSLSVLVGEEIDPLPLAEAFLRKGVWGEKELRELLVWSKSFSIPPSYSYLRAFLRPKEGIAPEVLNNKALRSRLLEALVKIHALSEKKLSELGFGEKEIEGTRRLRKKGIFGRIAALFNRG